MILSEKDLTHFDIDVNSEEFKEASAKLLTL